MDLLFLHQNFPAQFAHLAPALAQAGHRVTALTGRAGKPQTWRGIRVLPYRHDWPQAAHLHPWLTTMNAAVERGTAAMRAMLALKSRGYSPDAVIAHPGWGEALFLRDVWPQARIGLYCEYWYRATGADVGFDPEFGGPQEFGAAQRIRLKNLPQRLQLDMADAALSPTGWQADTYPPADRARITVAFDGIDTDAIRPDPAARLTLNGRSWTRDDEVITFVNRNLEPYRGFHVFMRALPDLLQRRPAAQVIVVGGDGISYGMPPPGGGTWRQTMLAELDSRLSPADLARLHFVGRLGRADFTRLLQISRVHVYLTYPFVLSWSLIEAMSAGCAIVASDTVPVAEVIENGRTGLLCGFFDGAGLVDRIDTLCRDAALRDRLGAAARTAVRARHDLAKVCLPAQMRWVETLSAGCRPRAIAARG
ncbi:hypothetical protein OCGS_1798 [Oceaniovalibus guishaninsula JLT2003]|uniref:Glycosyltransferase n=1 Tax=Oceaniovalibus guishaninsula JLT2003 TaxID=1231392 RepID=K2HCE4_9RHOB|nr:glycosyltransferase [Oceaniovalibus guishaninsula]EKE44282.1 hypothetical protein OCGS_1798 [Oceaniovalibus guishaninsula JLT2003]